MSPRGGCGPCVFAEVDLRKQLEEVKEILKAAPEGSQRYAKAKAIETEIVALLDQHRPDVLALGVAGRLLMSDEALEVLPLDDAELLDQATPVAAGKGPPNESAFTTVGVAYPGPSGVVEPRSRLNSCAPSRSIKEAAVTMAAAA
jgi:hypothetical protein